MVVHPKFFLSKYDVTVFSCIKDPQFEPAFFARQSKLALWFFLPGHPDCPVRICPDCPVGISPARTPARPRVRVSAVSDMSQAGALLPQGALVGKPLPSALPPVLPPAFVTLDEAAYDLELVGTPPTLDAPDDTGDGWRTVKLEEVRAKHFDFGHVIMNGAKALFMVLLVGRSEQPDVRRSVVRCVELCYARLERVASEDRRLGHVELTYCVASPKREQEFANTFAKCVGVMPLDERKFIFDLVAAPDVLPPVSPAPGALPGALPSADAAHCWEEPGYIPELMFTTTRHQYWRTAQLARVSVTEGGRELKRRKRKRMFYRLASQVHGLVSRVQLDGGDALCVRRCWRYDGGFGLDVAWTPQASEAEWGRVYVICK